MKNKISIVWLMLFLFGVSFVYMSNSCSYKHEQEYHDQGQYHDREQYQYGPPLIRGIPINIPTNVGYVPPPLARNIQLGILTSLSKENKILPLMGYPLFANRNKWRYYAMSDQNNSIQLPIIKNGRSCTNEYGCDMLNDGDRVYIDGYKQRFKVTLYETNNLTYIPY